jgi:hypothetical protein
MNYFTACGIHCMQVDVMVCGRSSGGTLAAGRRDRGATSIVGAVFTALLLVAGQRGEPIAAFRALPLDHSWKRLPGLALIARAAASSSVNCVPHWLVTAHWPLSRRLVRSHSLLQRLRRIGQVLARGGCRDCLRVLLQDQEYLDPVFPPNFRT